jgi:D-xylose reductase
MVEDPVPIHETWMAMEELYKEGLCKAIGISNFNVALIRDILSYATVKPSAL